MLTQKTAKKGGFSAKKVEFGEKMAGIPGWHGLTFRDLLHVVEDPNWFGRLLDVKPRTVQSWQQLTRAPQKDKAILISFISGGVLSAEKIYGPYVDAGVAELNELMGDLC